ncbi:hypothetical protein QAD02_007111 [Eretmocerus hayati]|uniref:Uncharacterized protein n=1 Tax=Eretmocerus hayati TaxID=131215 RepID=A0ACC2N546_9HYME|nr:hypothetical protein QAD02_007111 [Eretmocerus hayati]
MDSSVKWGEHGLGSLVDTNRPENSPPVDSNSENENLLELEVRDEDKFGDVETGAGDEPEISPVVKILGAGVDAEKSRADEIAGDRIDDRIANLQESQINYQVRLLQ